MIRVTERRDLEEVSIVPFFRRAVLILGSLLITAAAGVHCAHAAALEMIEITACGQQIPRRTIGYLSADLNCSTAFPSVGVYLGRRAQLDLRGFTLSGGYVSVSCDPPECEHLPCVSRRSRCEVYGGAIEDAGRTAIAGGRVSVHDLTISDSDTYAVLGHSRIDAVNVHLVSNPNGMQARKVRVTNSLLEASLVNATRGRLTSTTITGNRRFGVVGTSFRLIDAHIVGNGTSFVCETTLCADLFLKRRPRLDETSTCDVSLKINADPPTSLGVCALD